MDGSMLCFVPEESPLMEAPMDGIKKADMPIATLHAPTGVKTGTYRISPPLVKPSRLTSRQNGGVGKQLSDGWCCNFAIGCSHGCNFCYVDEIWKRFGQERYGKLVLERWGDYMLVPENIEGAIEETRWKKWAGKEVMMSSTHDAFLPTLAHWARRILEAALPEGVEFCIQTRSFLVTKCFDLLSDYREQVRLQVSIATMDRELARRIEKRVPPPAARLEILRKAKEAGLDTGVILAPIFPAMKARPDAEGDLRRLIAANGGDSARPHLRRVLAHPRSEPPTDSGGPPGGGPSDACLRQGHREDIPSRAREG